MFFTRPRVNRADHPKRSTASTLLSTYAAFIVDPLSLTRGVTFGVAAAVIASFFPALEAYRTTPGTGLRRSSLEGKVENLLPKLLIAWAVLCAIGAGLLALPGRSIVLAFAGLFAILIGFALVTPPVTVWFYALGGQTDGTVFLAPSAGWPPAISTAH